MFLEKGAGFELALKGQLGRGGEEAGGGGAGSASAVNPSIAPSLRAPYNIRRSSSSGTAEEEDVPFSSDEQKRR